MILIDEFSIKKYQKELKQSEELFHLCSEVQLFECLAFLKYTLSEHQLHFPLVTKHSWLCPSASDTLVLLRRTALYGER